MTLPATDTTHWTHAVCQTNGMQIHYTRTGGNKPPLIALHDLAGSGACWSALAQGLAKRYDLIMPDARGHGQSSAPLHGYTMHDHANDVIGLIRALNLDTPYLLGHGMGGMTAATVASRLGYAVGGIILTDPTFLYQDVQREGHATDIMRQHLQCLRASKAQLMQEERARHRQRPAHILECLIDARLQTSLSAFDVLIPPHPEFHELVRNIYVPTLLILGSEGILSAEMAQQLHRLHPELQYKLIEDAGHGLPYDKPVRLAAAVDAFVRPNLRMQQSLHRGEASALWQTRHA